MKVVELTQRQLLLLKPLKISKKTLYTDADLYYAPHHKKTIYKIYRTDDQRILERKEAAIDDLMSSNINIPNLVLPKSLILVNNHFKGIGLDYIKGKNLSIYLKFDSTPLNIQIRLLKELGKLLQRIRKANPGLNLAYGDVHPDNFMVKNNELYGIDTDGMNIHNHQGRISEFLITELAKKPQKFTLDGKGFVIPDSSSDIFCFIMILFQLIANNKFVFKISLKDYQKYLNYLDKMGFDTKLLECFASIYEPGKDIMDPTPYLDNLTRNEKTTYHSFLHK